MTMDEQITTVIDKIEREHKALLKRFEKIESNVAALNHDLREHLEGFCDFVLDELKDRGYSGGSNFMVDSRRIITFVPGYIRQGIAPAKIKSQN